jgi:HEAT repeat protein
LRESLPEFTVRHFVSNLDSLPEEWINTVGSLVRKIDVEAGAMLQKELTCLSPVRRRRAVQAAGAMGLVRELEQTVIGLLSDEDHRVRIEAAKALADCDSRPSWEALRDALLDRSVIVQEAAEQSLEQISQSLARETSKEKEAEPEQALS